MSLTGNGFTTSNAVTGQRIACNVHLFQPWPQPDGVGLNSTGATQVDRSAGGDPGFYFGNTGIGPGHITISKDGYETLELDVTFPLPTNIDYKITPTGGPAPTPPQTLHLEVKGINFVDAEGRPTCLSCVDQFQALRLFLDGRFSNLEALVEESHEFHFQYWRIFGMGAKSENTLFDLSPSEPGYYDALYQLARWLNARGIGLLFECYADNQVVGAGPEHWTRCADALRGTVTILSGGNEHEKNGFDPQTLSDPGMIWSRGSALADTLTPQNGATCASFHQRTDYPKTLYDATASVLYMESEGYTVCLMDEPTRFNVDGTTKSDPLDNGLTAEHFAWQLGKVYSAMWDLACFHNQAGQRGQLMSPPLRAMAAEWARGMHT